MKTLREMMDLVESAQTEETVDEGIKSALAGAALAGSLAMNPAQAQEPPSWQSQVEAAIKAGDIPKSNNIKLTQQAGWVTSVTINGQTLIDQANAEKTALVEQLRGTLDDTSRQKQLEKKSQEASTMRETFINFPMPIIIA
jgi:hypothetical protein